MSINERMKEVRTYFELTQEEFGARLGYGRAHISMLESGARQPTDRIINDISRIYGVNREWLVDGIGEMRGDETAFIEAIVGSLGVIDPEDREILVAYLQMPQEKRRAFRSFLEELISQKK